MNLRTGQPLTHLELPEENTAYVDVNEDGSVEQIRVAIDQQVMYMKCTCITGKNITDL